MSRGIGCEVMDTGAACRTYNVLVSEGRRAVAALLLSESEMPSPGQDGREKTRGTEVRSTNSAWRALKRASHDEIFLLFLLLFFFALFPRIPLLPPRLLPVTLRCVAKRRHWARMLDTR